MDSQGSFHNCVDSLNKEYNFEQAPEDATFFYERFSDVTDSLTRIQHIQVDSRVKYWSFGTKFEKRD